MAIIDPIYDKIIEPVILGIYDEEADAGWTPADITTALWYDASDSSTITESSGSVSQWDDKSGGSKNLVQALGGSQPTTDLVAAELNGLNTIRFDGTESMAESTKTNTTPFTRFLVYRDRAADGTIIYSAQSGNAFNLYVPSGVLAANNGTDLSSGINPTSAQEIISAVTFGGVSSEIFVDGDSKATGTTGTNSETGFTIGGWYNGGANADIDVAEIIDVEGISTANREKVEGYLAHKWGLLDNLPSDHPYKLNPPAQ